MAFSQADLDSLHAALASGELRGSYDGAMREFRSVKELKEAIEFVADNLAASAATPEIRQIVVVGSKGT